MFCLYVVTASGTYQTTLCFNTFAEAIQLYELHKDHEDHVKVYCNHYQRGFKEFNWDDTLAFLRDWP